MTVRELAKKLNADIFCEGETAKEVKGGYCGDLLSHVMGKAPEGCAWFTVMNNVNVAAVATLTEAAAVVLCEGVMPDAALAAKAKERGINLLITKLDIYNAVKTI